MTHTTPPLVNFQRKVDAWMQACFGPAIAADVTERNHRFLEEALELVQAKGCTASEAHQLVDYVFGRDVGEVNQEAGGVMVTLAALANAAGIDLHDAAETEVARVWTKIDKIREKQAAKPKHSPLPTRSVAEMIAEAEQELDLGPSVSRRQQLEVRLAMLKVAARSWTTVPQRATHRHKKRGSLYRLIGTGRMQSAHWLTSAFLRQEGVGAQYVERIFADNAEVVIYQSLDDGTIWVRPKEEFFDGRFEEVANGQ